MLYLHFKMYLLYVLMYCIDSPCSRVWLWLVFYLWHCVTTVYINRYFWIYFILSISSANTHTQKECVYQHHVSEPQSVTRLSNLPSEGPAGERSLELLRARLNCSSMVTPLTFISNVNITHHVHTETVWNCLLPLLLKGRLVVPVFELDCEKTERKKKSSHV